MKNLIAFGCGLMIVGRVFADAQSPLVTTLPASDMLNDTATLNGTVNPMGTNTTAWFEWDSNLGYGSNTPPQSVGSDTNDVAVNVALTNLTPGLTYHYRCVASNSLGVVRGTNQVFWLPALRLNGPNPKTNECHVPFIEPGSTVRGLPLAISAGDYHSLVLKADGTVVGWGYNNYGQTNSPAGATNVVAIAAGMYHSLALKADGSVVGWGYNNYGQTNSPASATNVVAIAAGGYHSLALKVDGSVVSWGGEDSNFEIAPASVTNVVAIAAGSYYHNLALKADGSVVGWGWNLFGQTTIPASATNVVAVAAGLGHSLALKADGTVVGWGAGTKNTGSWPYYGQALVPASATNVVAIAAGDYHSLALKGDGTIVCWGYNYYGQTNIPASATNVVAIAAGSSHSLALKADGTVVGWGYNNYGQISIPAGVYQLNLALSVSGTVDVNSPGTYVLTYSTTNALSAVATTNRTVIVTDTLPPVLTLLGNNPLMHELGAPFADPGATATDLCAGDLTESILITNSVNVNVPGSYQITYTVNDAYGHTAEVIRTVLVGVPHATTLPVSDLLNDTATLNGTVNPGGADTTAWFEWGTSMAYGNLTAPGTVGSGTNEVTVNVALTGLTPGVFYHYRCVASNSGWVVHGVDQVFWFWSPLLTLNSPNPMTNECHVAFVDPTTVNGSPLAIAAGYLHSLALKTDGTVVGWGQNAYGQITIPASATNVVAIAAGKYHSLVLKAGGTVVAWGFNGAGQTTIPASATNVVTIAAGSSHSLALRANGTVVGWGANDYGQTNSPVSATNVVAIAAGDYHSLALKADGSVVGWGRNNYGQITIPNSATNVVAIAAGYSYSLALKADGTVVGWVSGSPIPASATNVVAIAAGFFDSFALKADGTIIGWGENFFGQNTIPAGATNVVAIAASLADTPGHQHNLALKADGTVVGWGYNGYGETTIPASVYQLNLALSVGGTVDVNAPGSYVLTYSTTNALGAVATTNRTVIVADTLPPVLTLLGDNPLMHELGAPFADPGATATDLCAGDRTGSIFVWGDVNPDVAGSYPLLYIVTDTSGNLAVSNRTVVVVTRPVLTGLAQLGNGAFRFTFTNTPGARFSVLASTNVALPSSEWTALGSVTEGPPGVFQFTDDNATNLPACFYQLRWP